MVYLKFLLYPFAVLYHLATSVRNYLFDIGYKRSFEFDANVIGIGNLTVGGTGKTPMVEYLIRLLDDKKVATLSRGYGRTTTGFRVADDADTALTIGDEPLQLYKKFSPIAVTVGEERAMAIPEIIARLNPDVILMDDAYQHRYVKPSISLLLSDFTRPFYKDYVMPMGRLRESRRGAARADAIIVTKCPGGLSETDRKAIAREIGKYGKAPVFFSTLSYDAPIAVNEQHKSAGTDVILFSGLGNNKPLTQYVSAQFTLKDTISFPDHHRYTVKDMDKIEARFRQIPGTDKSIMTTEKDFVKLLDEPVYSRVRHWPLFYIPVAITFLEEGGQFDRMVKGAIEEHRR